MAEWFLGTMGFSYEDWAGPFYPENLAQSKFLKHFSRYFNAVEIDSTFYGKPRLQTVQRWYSTTPDHFRFCLKTPRSITHDKGLRGAHLEMAEFLTVLRELRDKLGVVLIQLPPSFTIDQTEVLAKFLGELPSDLNYAIEFRHQSWHQTNTYELLQMHNITWAATEYPDLSRGVQLTTGYIYFRLIGQHGQFERHDRQQIDRSMNLKWWYQHLDKQLDKVESIYGFFNNDYAGFGVGSCNQFKRMAGLPAKDLRPPQQGRLF